MGRFDCSAAILPINSSYKILPIKSSTALAIYLLITSIKPLFQLNDLVLTNSMKKQVKLLIH